MSQFQSRMAIFSALSLLGSFDMQMPISDGLMYRVEYPKRSISKTERKERKAKKNLAAKSKKRNRK